MKRRRHYGSIALAAALLAGCGTAEIASRWKTGEFIFLGPGSRWPASASVFDDRRMTGTVCNDSEYLYIGLRTASRDVQRLITREGITWWFDSEGGAKRTFGIRYPVPAGRRPADEGEGDIPTAEREIPSKPPAELDLFTGEKEHQRMSLLATGGIEAGFHRERDTLVYEMKIPLAAGAVHPFGIGTRTGGVIGLGAVTSNDRETLDLPVERPEGEGESEGGFGGRRSGGGGRGRSRTPDNPRMEQLNIWAKVHLATAP